MVNFIFGMVTMYLILSIITFFIDLFGKYANSTDIIIIALLAPCFPIVFLTKKIRKWVKK